MLLIRKIDNPRRFLCRRVHGIKPPDKRPRRPEQRESTPHIRGVYRGGTAKILFSYLLPFPAYGFLALFYGFVRFLRETGKRNRIRGRYKRVPVSGKRRDNRIELIGNTAEHGQTGVRSGRRGVRYKLLCIPSERMYELVYLVSEQRGAGGCIEIARFKLALQLRYMPGKKRIRVGINAEHGIQLFCGLAKPKIAFFAVKRVRKRKKILIPVGIAFAKSLVHYLVYHYGRFGFVGGAYIGGNTQIGKAAAYLRKAEGVHRRYIRRRKQHKLTCYMTVRRILRRRLHKTAVQLPAEVRRGGAGEGDYKTAADISARKQRTEYTLGHNRGLSASGACRNDNRITRIVYCCRLRLCELRQRFSPPFPTPCNGRTPCIRRSGRHSPCRP